MSPSQVPRDSCLVLSDSALWTQPSFSLKMTEMIYWSSKFPVGFLVDRVINQLIMAKAWYTHTGVQHFILLLRWIFDAEFTDGYSRNSSKWISRLWFLCLWHCAWSFTVLFIYDRSVFAILRVGSLIFQKKSIFSQLVLWKVELDFSAFSTSNEIYCLPFIGMEEETQNVVTLNLSNHIENAVIGNMDELNL